jgi:hypothetical protein
VIGSLALKARTTFVEKLVTGLAAIVILIGLVAADVVRPAITGQYSESLRGDQAVRSSRARRRPAVHLYQPKAPSRAYASGGLH